MNELLSILWQAFLDWIAPYPDGQKPKRKRKPPPETECDITPMTVHGNYPRLSNIFKWLSRETGKPEKIINYDYDDNYPPFQVHEQVWCRGRTKRKPTDTSFRVGGGRKGTR